MLRIGKETRHSPQQVLAKATAFFGPGGTGLDVILQGPHALRFTGGGGFILVQAKPGQEEGNEGAEIEIQTQEWDYDVKRFLNRV